MNSFYWAERDLSREFKKSVKIPKGCINLWRDIKPQTYYYHYSNEDSQNALICTTSNFPDFVHPNKCKLCSAYSDRLRSWDSKNYDDICELIGSDEQNWAYKLPEFDDNKLKEIAKLAFKEYALPNHVMFVHAYNVASGYSCPYIIAIFGKDE